MGDMCAKHGPYYPPYPGCPKCREERHQNREENAAAWAAESARLREENERLRAGVLAGLGAALNEIASQGLPLEWSPNSGIGQMCAALGIDQSEEAARAVLDGKGG